MLDTDEFAFAANSAVFTRKRSEWERGRRDCGLRMTLKVSKDKGRMSPPSWLTRNFFGNEVLILKATGEVGFRERSRSSALAVECELYAHLCGLAHFHQCLLHLPKLDSLSGIGIGLGSW